MKTEYLSHPAWGGWIEIACCAAYLICHLGPTPHGVGGLKYDHEFTVFLHRLSHPTWVD